MGQGGEPTSFGMDGIAKHLRANGVECDVYVYQDYQPAISRILAYRGLGFKIGCVGYSLGCTDVTYIGSQLPLDLAICIAESPFAQNHKISHPNIKRSVLFHSPEFLSSAGTHDGFDKVVELSPWPFAIPVLGHLSADYSSVVLAGVLDEFARL